jgi:hypothetical protein
MGERVVSRWSGLYKVSLLLAGVALPVVSIGVEVVTAMCAETFFDPVPTVWHVLLAAFVPVANLQVWLACRRGETRRAGVLGFVNSFAIGVALFYTIVFASLLPLAVVALLFAGMGLLPMSPLAALVAGLLLRRELRGLAPETREQPRSTWTRAGGLAAGVALALLTICIVELPATVTRVGLDWAASEQPERRERGLSLLRAWGSREHLLRACYERRGEATDAIGFLFSMRDPVTPEEARTVYYRMTGDTFDAVAAPRLAGRWNPAREFDFDAMQGGESVGGRLKDLALQESRLDGSVDADARLAYMEWTLVFKNDGSVQREARAQVQLPPGAVVSRLTLWVNGEEREAAFAGRNRVRAAYEAIVRQRRDPVLVTTSGEDRVLVQCFPVMPQGATMKIRLGITTPLVPEDRRASTLLMPAFVERNFNIGENFKHSIWLESKSALETASANFQAEHPAENLFALRGALSDDELMESSAAVRLNAASETARSYTRLAADEGGKASGDFIRQTLTESDAATFRHVVLVVDGSSYMQPHLEKDSRTRCGICRSNFH